MYFIWIQNIVSPHCPADILTQLTNMHESTHTHTQPSHIGTYMWQSGIFNVWLFCHSLRGLYFVLTWWVKCCLMSSDVSWRIKPILNWANVCSPEHTSDTSTNYDSFLNWTFSSPNMVRTVQTLLHSQLACNEMQASARTCGRRAADSMIKNVG